MLAATKVNLKPGQLLIDGQWIDGAKKFDTINPATGEVLTQIAEASAADVDRAVEAARGVRRPQRPVAQAVRQRAWTSDLEAGRSGREECRRTCRTGNPRQRQADLRIALCRYADGDRRSALLRGTGDEDPRRDRQHFRNRFYLHPARAGRRRRTDRSVEFPVCCWLRGRLVQRWLAATRSC